MSRSRKAEKRQKRKEKKREELKKTIAQEKVKFDVLDLLLHWQLDTKPNMAKFLKEHVQMIRCFNNNGKIQFYPNFKYELTKVFVRFLDGHELIYDMQTDGIISPKYYLYDDLDEVPLTNSDLEHIEQFFQLLIQFKFIY